MGPQQRGCSEVWNAGSCGQEQCWNSSHLQSCVHHWSRQKTEVVSALPRHHRQKLDEIIRVIDSLQLTARRKVATPVDWRQEEPAWWSPVSRWRMLLASSPR